MQKNIHKRDQIQIDFCTVGNIELNEGESTFYFGYESFEDVIKSAESFLKKTVSEWTNYNRTWNEWYFQPYEAESDKRLSEDLQKRRLEFPENFKYMRICSTYELGVFLGKINPYNDDNVFDDWDYLCSLDHEFTEY